MPVDLNLPVPGQSPNWGQQLNDEIEKLNQSMNQGVFLTSDYGVVGDGVADDTASMQNLIDSVPDGSTIVSPPNSILRSRGWVLEGKSLSFDLRNSQLVKSSNTAPIFSATGSWATPVSVSSVSGRFLSVASTASFQVGDLVKVYSDDVIPDARPRIPSDGSSPTEFARNGEFTIVSAITDGSNLEVRPAPRDTYSTNIRIAKMEDLPVTFKFGTATFDSSGSGGTAFLRGMFSFKSLNAPVFEGRVLRAPGAALGVTSCYAPDVKITVSNLPAGDGYGVACSGTAYGAFDIKAEKCRHAFTDDTAARIVAGQSDPSLFGRAEHNTITGHSISTWGASWDTHHGGRNQKFVGISGSGAGQDEPIFSLRGNGHQLIGCSAANASVGFRFHDEGSQTPSGVGTWATTRGHLLTGCSTRDVYTAFNASTSFFWPISDGPTAQIDGGIFETTGGYFMYNRNTRIVFNDPEFRAVNGRAMAAANGRLFNSGLSDYFGSLRIDLSNWTDGTINGIFAYANTAERRPSIDLDVRLEISEFGTQNLAVLTRHEYAVGQTRWRINRPLVNPPIGSLNLSPSAQNIIWECRGPGSGPGLGSGPSTSSRLVSVNFAANGALSPVRSADPDVMIRLSLTADRTVGSIDAGAVASQRLVVLNSGGSTGTLTIPSGLANLGATASTTVAPGQKREYIWDGVSNTWIPMNY